MLPFNPARFGHRAAHAPAPASYESESVTYFAAMSVQPDAARKGLINTLIAGLKSDGVWSQLGWLCLLAAHDEQAGRLNAINTAKALSAVNSPTFTTDRGFTGDGSTAYMDFGEQATASGNNYSQNACSRGVWCNSQTNTSSATMFSDNSASFRGHIGAIATGGTETIRASDATGDTRTSSSKLGHRAFSRTASNVKRGFLNGVRDINVSTASTGTAAANARLMANNAASCADRLAAAWLGGGLSDTDVANLHSRLNTYLTAIGGN